MVLEALGLVVLYNWNSGAPIMALYSQTKLGPKEVLEVMVIPEVQAAMETRLGVLVMKDAYASVFHIRIVRTEMT